jgi:pSer/pThr/pTyr-binding forkhead associated (FHA) protein
MAQLNDLKVFIQFEGDTIPLEESMTVGRHLENDLIVAGEDVLDFHLRLEPTDRGARAYPLGEASLTLESGDWTDPVDLVVGDRLQVGQNELVVSTERQGPPQAEEWWIFADREESIYQLTSTLDAGRSDDNEILLLDDHVSRKHARFSLVDGIVWISDFRSANGTYVNGNRLNGGCRLFHGDEISFDQLRFQLVGRGGDLTPVRQPESGTEVVLISPPSRAPVETTEFNLAEPRSEPSLVVPETPETGAFLLGASDPITGQTFRAGIGTLTIGRDEDCDVVIDDATVSARHAELVIRPETTTVTNLMATNGTRINGEQIQNAELKDGDVLRIGRVNLVFRDVPSPPKAGNAGRWRWVAAGAGLIAALVLAWLLL